MISLFKYAALLLYIIIFTADCKADRLEIFKLKEYPQIKIVARQSFLDFIIDIGVDQFTSHKDAISVDSVVTHDHVAVLGDVEVDLNDISCQEIVIPKDSIALTLQGSSYMLESVGMTSKFNFLWRWHKGILGGHGKGSLGLSDGNIQLKFAISQGDDGIFIFRTLTSTATFSKIDLDMQATRLNWLYQIVLRLFRGSIKNKIQNKISDFMQSELPGIINEKLAKVPQQIEIDGFPFKNELTYSVFSSHYILFQGFEQIQSVSAQVRPISSQIRSTSAQAGSTSTQAGSTSTQAGSTSAQKNSTAAQVGFKMAKQEESTDVVQKVLKTNHEAQTTQNKPSLSKTDHSNASNALKKTLARLQNIIQSQSEECQYQASKLDLQPADIMQSPRMFSGFLHQSFFNCATWALHKEDKLHKTIKDGDIKGVRLITDLFMVLIPGIENDYPGQTMLVKADSLSRPDISLGDESMVQLQTEFMETLFVQKKDQAQQDVQKQIYKNYKASSQHTIGFEDNLDEDLMDDNIIQVAKMSVKLNLTAYVSYNETRIHAVNVEHQLVESQYNIEPERWDYTVKYALQTYGKYFTVKQVADQYLNLNIKQLNMSVANTQLEFFKEWAKVEGDIRIN